MNAIHLLEQQHRELEYLFKMLEGSEGSEKRRIFEDLADSIAIHATIEETIFYPSVMAAATEDTLREAVEEHLSVKRLLADLLEMAVLDPEFDAKVAVLREQVRHHVEEEESELFPKVKEEFFGDLDDLGGQLEAMTAELDTQGDARAAVPAQTHAAAPLE